MGLGGTPRRSRRPARWVLPSNTLSIAYNKQLNWEAREQEASERGREGEGSEGPTGKPTPWQCLLTGWVHQGPHANWE